MTCNTSDSSSGSTHKDHISGFGLTQFEQAKVCRQSEEYTKIFEIVKIFFLNKGCLYTLVLRELRLQRKLEDLQNPAEAPSDRTCREDRVERWRDPRLYDSSSPSNPEQEFQQEIARFWIQLPYKI